jgi:hypothetical protein
MVCPEPPGARLHVEYAREVDTRLDVEGLGRVRCQPARVARSGKSLVPKLIVPAVAVDANRPSRPNMPRARSPRARTGYRRKRLFVDAMMPAISLANLKEKVCLF